ncbi:alpha/beta hydrolase [Fodinicurvata sp. EGI_FJ10296]|uniref:alpha/beta fold hydrolase n=1 Tax=Fodinicurvata sp. EGI_FJ10296 TaxID=3231908 RepID=UPI003452FD9B
MYTEFGLSKADDTVVCVHGLTRNGRDFDVLAKNLAQSARVVCPDVVGRGRSDWLPQGVDYEYDQYCTDMAVLIGRLERDQIDWIGTSMGGIIGMMLAARPNSPIRRLILNDIGPVVPTEGLARVAAFVGEDPVFDSIAQLETYMRRVHAPFGILNDWQWRHLATHSARQLPDGRLALAYDPRISKPFRDQPLKEVDIWPLWDAIKCPVLVLRGASSDILDRETAAEMQTRGPCAKVVEFPECGHAPSLMDDDHVDIIHDWLFGSGGV